MTPKQLRKCCSEWQAKLRLSEWDVQVRFVPVREMPSQHHLGMVQWHLDEKHANISLVKPGQESTEIMRPYNVEETLVHELLHLLLAPIDVEDGLASTALEFSINAIAGALVRAPKS